MTNHQVKNLFPKKKLVEIHMVDESVDFYCYVAKNKSKIYYIKIDTQGEYDPHIQEVMKL